MNPKNLTFEQKLIRPATAPEAKPGHSLVVFEESRKGSRLFQIAPPGEPFKAPLWRFGAAFVAYHVIADDNLRLEWTRSCETLDQKHAYELHLVLVYSVRRADLLIGKMHTDPLQRVQKQMEVQVLERVQHLAWGTIREGADEFKRVLLERLPDASGVLVTCLEQLRTFSSAYGLEISGVGIERTLPEDELVVARDEVFRENERGLAKNQVETQLVVEELKAKMESELSAKIVLLEMESADLKLRLEQQRIEGVRQVEAMKAEAVRELEKRKVEVEHDFELRKTDFEREKLKARIPLELEKQHHEQAFKLRSLVDDVTEMVKGMLDRSGKKIDSFPEMGRALKSMSEIRDMAGKLFFGQASVEGSLLGGRTAIFGEENRNDARGSSTAIKALVDMLMSLCDLFARYEPKVRGHVLSCALHLIAEAIRKDEQSADLADSCRAQISQLISEHAFERDEFQLLRQLADPSLLTQCLEVVLERD